MTGRARGLLLLFVPSHSVSISPDTKKRFPLSLLITTKDPKWAAHKADPSRAQEDLSNGFGMEDRGVPREWNDEYQCLLELPSDTPDLVRDLA